MTWNFGIKKTIKLALQYPGLVLLPAFSFWTFAGLQPTCCNKKAAEFGVSPLLRIIHWFLFHLGFFCWYIYADPTFEILYFVIEESLTRVGLQSIPGYIGIAMFVVPNLLLMAIVFLLDKFKCLFCCSCCLPFTQKTAITFEE